MCLVCTAVAQRVLCSERVFCFVWLTQGYTGNGQNVLGKLLALVRKELGAAN